MVGDWYDGFDGVGMAETNSVKSIEVELVKVTEVCLRISGTGPTKDVLMVREAS